MALVRRNIPPIVTLGSNYSQGVLLVFEYTWFLLQQTKDVECNHPALIALAIKAYQTSGTQISVLNALQPAIEEHIDNHDMFTNVIIDIIHKHRMCKCILIKTKVSSV